MLFRKKKSLVLSVLFILSLLGGMIGIVPAVQASTLTVTNTNDSGSGSLRQAIADATSGDTITFNPSLAGGAISLGSALVIDKDLTIDGSGLPSQISLGGSPSRIIQIQNSAVTISRLTFTNGNSTGDGGAIWSNGNLTLINSTIKDSHANGNGGAIYNSGSLMIKNVALYQNEADVDGGGIFIANNGGLVSIVNTTISQNYAQQHGGGIYTIGSPVVSIINSTIAQNNAPTGSQIVSRGLSELIFDNSVVACWWWVNANCIDFQLTPSISSSILGSWGNNYGLEELANNGGPTKTMSVLATSPLIDAGDDTVCADPLVNNMDQRGQARPKGAHCDIGAFEVDYRTVSGSAGVGGATIRYGYGLFTLADNNGFYSMKVLPGWSGTVIPTKQGYSFMPITKNYTNIQINQTNQSYIASSNSYTPPSNLGDTWRVSITSSDTQSDDDSYDPSISADGRYVAFSSYASNLTPQDTDYVVDIFVYDNETGTNSVVSVHSDGSKFQENSYTPSISADGRFVAFVSFEWFGTPVIFVRDRQAGITTGLPFDGPPSFSARPAISADGRYVAYMDNGILTEGDTNDKFDIFIYDQWSTSIKRVSVLSDGTQANGDSLLPSISADGRYVAFYSSATNLVNGDTNGVEDVFVHDTQIGTTTRVSITSNGMQANGGSFTPSISADGRYIAFYSSATNLAGGDTNSANDVFVHDLQTGETTRVSANSNGIVGNNASDMPRLSGNGRYVAFRSSATNLIAGDTNGMADIFMYDRETGFNRRVSVDSNGSQANGNSPSSYSPGFSLSADGQYVAFSSDATNLVTSDTNAKADIFVHRASPANVEVNIGGSDVANHTISPQSNLRTNYPGIDSGPVKVTSTNAVPIVTALRDLWSDGGNPTSSIQLMGLPENQLSDTYWFPAYNNVSLDDQLRFGNVGTAPTTVTVTIGGVVQGTYTNIQPNQSIRVNYAGVDSGPVKVQSSGGVKIIASIRDSWHDGTKWSSYAQLMGLPNSQLSDTYLFPAYNNVSLDDQIRFGNVGTAPTQVTVTIGGTVMQTYTLQPNQSMRVNYPGVDGGPVKVQSSGGVKIIASIRDAWFDGTKWTSYFQLMGLPASQLSDTYVFPAYDNVSLDGQLRFANVGTSPTTVTVTINGVVKGTYPLNPSQSVRVNFAGLDSGPVKIQSSGGVKIIASLRDAWFDGTSWTSYSQLMGLPGGQLTTSYYFPAYNNVTYDNQLRIGVP